MSSSVLMATQVTSWSCPQSTCTGRGEIPLEKPAFNTERGSDRAWTWRGTADPPLGGYLLEDFPHDAGGVPGARDEVDATEIQCQARYNIFTQERYIYIYIHTPTSLSIILLRLKGYATIAVDWPLPVLPRVRYVV